MRRVSSMAFRILIQYSFSPQSTVSSTNRKGYQSLYAVRVSRKMFQVYPKALSSIVRMLMIMAEHKK